MYTVDLAFHHGHEVETDIVLSQSGGFEHTRLTYIGTPSGLWLHDKDLMDLVKSIDTAVPKFMAKYLTVAAPKGAKLVQPALPPHDIRTVVRNMTSAVLGLYEGHCLVNMVSLMQNHLLVYALLVPRVLNLTYRMHRTPRTSYDAAWGDFCKIATRGPMRCLTPIDELVKDPLRIWGVLPCIKGKAGIVSGSWPLAWDLIDVSPGCQTREHACPASTRFR
jgi:hypothetical protein